MIPPIAAYQHTREILRENNLVAKKSLGQNFLIDTHIRDKIIRMADIQKNDFVIEIGPGLGGLTQALAEKAGQVTAVEIDPVLAGLLRENLGAYENLDVIQDDILKLDWKELAGDQTSSVKVVANLPYYITTPILMHLLEGRPRQATGLTSLTVMVQKEVADRIKAGPGGKEYGALSLAVQYYAEVAGTASVPPNCFFPRPGVDSAVLHLRVYENTPFEGEQEELLFKIIRAAFGQRRKTLVNCLHKAFGMDKEKEAALLTGCGVDAGTRGEALDLAAFMKIARALSPGSPAEFD